MKRILTALVAVPILVYIIRSPNPIYFDLTVGLSTILALEEYFSLAHQTSFQVYRVWGHLFSLTMLLGFFLNPNNQSMGFLLLGLAAVLFLVLGLRKSDQLNQVLLKAAASLLGLAYIPATLGLLIVIRSQVETRSQGGNWILFLLAVVWFGDTGAYYTGRALGKRKLAPAISPKKTIEGSLGGLAASIVAAIMTKKFLLPQLPLTHLLLLAGILGVISQIGDLAESALKRGAGVKDSSNVLPGHGGMLDRLDGLIFATPTLYCYTKFFHL
jgi:phosphatidate cytidylyltransferase